MSEAAHDTTEHPVRRYRGAWRTCGFLAVGVAIAAGLAMRWQYAREAAVNEDELQHLHFAWCITQGITPYRDFWDNHPPALHHALARFIDPEAKPSTALLAARMWLLPAGIATLIGTFLLARSVFDTRVAALAVAWLACCEAFVVKTAELRPDTPWSAAIVAAIWLCVIAMKSSKPRVTVRVCFGAGLLFGVGMTLSTKTLIPLGVCAAAWLVSRYKSCRDFSARRTATAAGALIFGFAIPLAIWLGFEASHGALAPALRYTILDNFSDPDRFNPLLALHGAWPYGFLAAGLIGGGLVLRASRREPGQHREALFLVLATFGTAAVYAFFMPSPFLQSTLMFLPLFAILAAVVTGALIDGLAPDRADRKRRLTWAGVALCVVFGFVHPLLRMQLRRPNERAAQAAMLARMDWIHDWTSKNDVVFDGLCIATFRRHAASRPALVGGALRGYWLGLTEHTIRDELRHSGCTVVVHDARTAEIPPLDLSFIASHFVPIDGVDETVSLPGCRFAADVLEGNGAVFDAFVPGAYRVRRGDDESITWVDDLAVQGSVELTGGRHPIRSTGRSSDLTIWRPPGQ